MTKAAGGVRRGEHLGPGAHDGALARSLVNVAAGETVTVRRILFDALRSHCHERGIDEGSLLSRRAADPGQVIVETSGGRAVPCERRYARFIQVTG